MNRLLVSVAAIALLAYPAEAQIVMGNGGSGGGGSGTVTSITAGNGILVTPSPITTTGVVGTTVTNNAQTGTTYAVLGTDGGKVVSASNSSSEAYSIAAANTTGFTSGFGFDLNNIGAGVTTLTATTSVFDNGLTTLALVKGQDAYIYSDGANYHSVVSMPVLAADTLLGNFSAASNYPIAGALTSCSGASNALTYNTSTHAFGCNTISGSGSPGGSTTQVQYNNAGAFGGISGLTTDGTRMTNAAAGAASAPAETFSGAPFAGTATTSFPLLYLNSGTAPTTFSTGGTALGINEPSAFAGNAIDLHLNGGASIFSVSSAGAITTASTVAATGAITSSGNLVAGGSSQIRFSGSGIITSTGANNIQFGPTTVGASTAQSVSFNSGAGTNIAGSDATFQASKGSGTAAQGSLIFIVGTPTTSGTGYGANISALTLFGSSGQANFGGGIVSATQVTIPTATGTGTPTVTSGSTDAAGSVTPGTSGTSVIITSGNAGYTTAPLCIVQPVTQLVAFTAPVTVGTVTAGHWTISVTQTASVGLITWHCWKNT